MYKRKQTTLTPEELQRFNEIVFYHFVTNLLKTFNVVKAVHFIEAICLIDAKNNATMITNLIHALISDQKKYTPSLHEMVYLMIQAMVPVREICKTPKITRYVYEVQKAKGRATIKCVYSDKQYEAVVIFLDTVQKINTPLERVGL